MEGIQGDEKQQKVEDHGKDEDSRTRQTVQARSDFPDSFWRKEIKI